MKEIERKFRLSKEQADKIRKYIRFRSPRSKEKIQKDQVFLYKMDSFRNFKPGDPVARIRNDGQVTILTLKKTINQSGDSNEYETRVDSVMVAKNIIESIGFKKVVEINKKRIEIQEDGLTIALDLVERLGEYLEIELLTSDDPTDEVEALIFSKAEELGIGRESLEVKKYDRLIQEQTKH